MSSFETKRIGLQRTSTYDARITAKDTRATIKEMFETVSSVRSFPRLHSEDPQEKLASAIQPAIE
jgi:hypothetical protein